MKEHALIAGLEALPRIDKRLLLACFAAALAALLVGIVFGCAMPLVRQQSETISPMER